MKEIPVPEDEARKNKKRASLMRRSKALRALVLAFAAFVLLCLTATLVFVILMGVGSKSNEKLYGILSLSFVGGMFFFAAVMGIFYRLAKRALETETDYRERCDGVNSFFVSDPADGTLGTFAENEFRIHTENGVGKEIKIPYAELRFYSVCMRHAPCEAGEWSVIVEAPAKRLAKAGQPVEGKTAFIQTDAKERLYRRLDELNLPVTGERKKKEKGKKFTRLKKFTFPDKEGRRRALIQTALGAVLAGAGVGLAFWQVTVGCILAAVGLFVVGRGALSVARKNGALAVYEEGIYWKEEKIEDRVFLKWEEIETVSKEEKRGAALLKVTCPFGAFHFLSNDEVFAFIKQTHPEKCVE